MIDYASLLRLLVERKRVSKRNLARYDADDDALPNDALNGKVVTRPQNSLTW
jgi:hypothetical protein